MHLAGARGSGHLSLPHYDVLEGSIDALNRPFVRIDLPDFSDPVVAFIDTGFNGAILIDEMQAAKLRFRVFKNQRAPVILASEQQAEFWLGRGSFPWFGESRLIAAYVLIESEEARRARILRKTEEEILVGTELLSTCRLTIDFPARKVLIARVE
jgi:predicted aspartyl protease